MKQHTIIGARMLDRLEMYHDEEMMKYAYEICRWHHERYDGKGYPDGLKEKKSYICPGGITGRCV